MNLVMRLLVFVAGVVGSSLAFSKEVCTQLPASLQTVGVSNIGQTAELQRLDEQLEGYLQPCLVPLSPQNRKNICANGKLVAEQALRVVARIDEAGKKNPVLSNAKMKTYKTGVALLDQMKKHASDKACA